jgi:hypothetical protein
MRVARNSNGPEPVALKMSYDQLGRLLGLVDVAADMGLDTTGISYQLGFAYDASEFGPRIGEQIPGRQSPVASRSPDPQSPVASRQSLSHELLGGDPAAAIAERAAGFSLSI